MDYFAHRAKEFKPVEAISVVHMTDDGGFAIEPSPGWLIFENESGGIDVVAAELDNAGIGELWISGNRVGVYSDTEARERFEDAKWSFYLGSDPDDIEIRTRHDGSFYAWIEWKVFVTKGPSGESWELSYCSGDMLPADIQTNLQALAQDAIERYELHTDAVELTAGLGTVEV